MWRSEESPAGVAARVAVVVPAKDESRFIGGVIRGLPAWVDHVVVVDDASVDGTTEAARAVGDARVEVLRHRENRGVGAAIAAGYRQAFERGADIAVVMAGDGQMDPRDLPRLVACVARGDAGYAKGERLSHPDARRVMPRMRRLGTAALSALTRLATGLDIEDAQCGYTALARDAAAKLELDTLWPRYGYPNDLLARCARRGVRVRDVPVRPVYGAEQSGLRWRDGLVVIPLVIARGALSR